MSVERPRRPSTPSPGNAENTRQHTRHERQLRVRLFRQGKSGNTVDFSANVSSRDISVGGVFLQSTFFVKVGTEITVEIDLPELEEIIRIDGVVVRHEDRRERTGFAIRFKGFHEDAALLLRAYLTKGDVLAFVDEQASSIFPAASVAQRKKLVELIVQWEIHRGRDQRESKEIPGAAHRKPQPPTPPTPRKRP